MVRARPQSQEWADPPPKSVGELVCDQLASRWGLSPVPGRDLRAERILNWGGFVNQSFKVSSGGAAYHVKLSDDPETLRGLTRWRHLSGRLSAKYAAPVLRDWIEIPGTPLSGPPLSGTSLSAPPLSGPVFDWIEGASPADLTPAVRAAATDLLRDLHQDGELAMMLLELGDTEWSCATVYEATFHDRFVQDLQGVLTSPPPFVTGTRIEWMHAEAEALRAGVVGSSAFAEPANVACHRDLWSNNLIVTAEGALHVIDWDGLGLGDPMMDWATLLGPTPTAPRVAAATELPKLGFTSPALERFAHYQRAVLLDWVIDSLADWIEAAGSDHRDTVREAKRRAHEEALSLYHVSFG